MTPTTRLGRIIFAREVSFNVVYDYYQLYVCESVCVNRGYEGRLWLSSYAFFLYCMPILTTVMLEWY